MGIGKARICYKIRLFLKGLATDQSFFCSSKRKLMSNEDINDKHPRLKDHY